MKRIWLISILLGLGVISAVSQDSIVSIPDTAFLFALIDEGVDTNKDSQITYAEAEAIITLDLYRQGILDLSGIGAFVNLEMLDCGLNQLTSLDVSTNTALVDLSCGGNQLSSLDLSNNTALKYLFCHGNQLTSLDLISNTSLTILICSGNLLTNLDLSNNKGIRDYYHGVITPPAGLGLSDMPTLGEVLVWTLPFPYPGLTVLTRNSPNVYFSDCVAPEILSILDLFLPQSIYVSSSENGSIYEVPEGTEKDIVAIRTVCIDSIAALANANVRLDVSGLDNGIYWFYARDLSGNISEPKAFTIEGVGIENELSEQFRIFPNPVQNQLIIESNGNNSWSAEITSLNGQLIFSEEMEGTIHQIDLSSFQKGVYFITIKSKDFVTTRKIIKL